MDKRMANRQVCDVSFADFKTNEPVLFFDTANTSSFNLTADNVYAMAKGERRIDFPEAMVGEVVLEFQVFPFRMLSMLSDGTIGTTGAYAVHKTIKCTTAGEISLTAGTDETITAGTVFVYPEGEYGNPDSKIAGTFASNKFTATTDSDIAANAYYEVGYMVSRTGVGVIEFNNNKLPKTYTVTMSTLFKDVDGTFTPYLIKLYKAVVVRNFEMSFSSEGDPASLSLTLSCLSTNDGKMADMIELTDDAT